MNLLLFSKNFYFMKDFIHLIARTSNAKAREQLLKIATKPRKKCQSEARLDDKFIKSIKSV